MLVSFTIENWMSFRCRTSFSMVATKERQHNHRVPRIKKYQTRVLPVALIYGGNASGKTNFFMALSFAKKLITQGTKPYGAIPVQTFTMDEASRSQPARFCLEILAGESIYEYSFDLTGEKILSEKLVEVRSASERVLYDRRNGKPNFHSSLAKDDFLNFAFKGTRENQLFLTNTISQGIVNFQPVYDWFRNSLELIAPDSRFEPFEQFIDEGSPLYFEINKVLRSLDTGIHSLGGEDIDIKSIPIPDELRTELQEELEEGVTVRLLDGLGHHRFLVTRKGGKLNAKKLISHHQNEVGDSTKFEMHQESDGTRRVLDLLPAMLHLSDRKDSKVYVIDEIDRSLHPVLVRKLLEEYLATCTETSRSQLLATTHDIHLMDQRIFRRDEMWLTERNAAGVSSLFSLSDFQDVRYDKNILRSYLQGRMGGIPNIGSDTLLLR